MSSNLFWFLYMYFIKFNLH
uniref:Uncharacterized protein n=1 Tax=Arundo donax TaxID=35708 RepID=A0A0A9CL42_ARUDO